MKKIPGACWIISAILMVLSAASFAAESNEVILQLDNVTDGYYINLPSFGTQTLNVSAGVTTFSVYDDGGKDDEYSSGVIGCLVINAPAKKLLKLTGAMDANQDYAYLAVYEGNSTSSSYSFYETGYFSDITQADSYDIGAVSVMTICFESTDDAYGSYGLDLMVTVINGNAVEVKTATGGKIEVGSGVAVNGSTVTVTATPSAGYVFAGLNITDLEDGTVAATATVVGNKATFTMPNKDVNVEPVFSAVTYGSNGCLSGDVYFHLDCDDSGSNPACELSQISTDSPSSDDYHCWYRTDGTNSEGVWVALKAYSNVELSLASNLDLGGYDGSVCRMTFRPISIASLEGNGKIIDGLCFVTSGNAGFVSELNGYNRSYSNVVFTNAYVEGAKAGVLAPASSQGVDVSKVTVDGATVIGDDAGGVVGDFYGFQANYASVSEIIVKNISVIASSAGGALAACGDVVFNGNSFEFSNNTIQAASTATGIVNLGGVMGSYGNDNSSRISTFSLTGTTIKNESSASLANMGGLFGYFPDIGAYLMGSAVLNISESSFEGTISGGHNVGGLIGKAAVSSSNLNISNTYSVGDLIGSGEVNRDTLGYIVGNVYYNGSPVTVRGTITNNYHFGSDAVKLGIGSYTESNWLKGSDYVYGNVRNAGSNFTANGELSLYTYTTGCGGVSYIDFFAPGSFVDLYEPQNPVRNGIAADDDMKSDKFAALLNKNTEYEYTWSRVTGKNGGLPILSGTNNNYVILVYLDNGLNFSTTELSTYGFREYHYEYCADGGNNGWPTYAMVGFTNENGQLSKGFVDSVNAVIEGMANDEHNPRLLSLVDADNPRSRIKLSVESAFGRGDNLKLKTAFKFNVVYQYCDDDPSVAATTCENIEDVNDKTFIFMSPRVNYFMTDFSLENTIVPMLSILNDPVELQYNVEYQDASGNSVNVGHTNDGLSGFRLASSIIDDSYSNVADVKNIVLKYWPNGQPGSQSIIVKNPSAAKFYVTMASDAVDGATHEVVSKVSTINGNGVADEVSVPYSRYLKATDFVCKTGYACDTYAVSFSVTERTSCTDAQPSVIPPNYVENNNFATVDEILSSVDGGCIKATWVVEGLQPGAEVDLVNVLLADLTKNKAANPFDEMEIAVTPKFELITYNVTFDIGGTEQITDGSIPDIQDYEIYVEDNLNAPISYNLEAQTKALPMLYAVTQNYSDANTTAGKMYSSVWTTKSDKARCVLGKGDCADYASSYNQFSASLLESAGDDIKQVEGEDPALELYPVWAAGSANPVSHVVVDCDGDLACKDGDVFTLVLTQIVSMGGKEYVFEHRSARGADDLGGPSIPLPQGAGGEFKFAISAHVKAGYSIDNDGYYFEDNNSKSYDKEPFVYKSPSQDPVKIYYKGWSYSLNEYTVNFDLQSLTYAVLGKNWNASKENMDVSSDHHELSRVYVMDDVNPLSPDFGKADWTPVLDENDPNYFVDNELTSDLLSHVNPLTSEFTLYPKVTGRPLGTGKIVVKEYDEYGNLLPDASSYHGNVVLKQKVSDEEDAQTFKQTSSACDIDLIDTDGNVTGFENVHCLYIPNVDDTLTFEVSFEPKKGYAIKSIDAAFLWQDPTGGDPEEKAGFGFKATDTDTTLVINPSTMARPGMYINVMYISKNVGSYYITYDLNAIDNLGNDWSNNIYLPRGAQNTVGFPDKALRDALKKGESIYLLKPVRSNGMCFDGWTTENGGGKYTGADAIIDDPGNVRSFSTDKDNPTVLYAAWKSCDGNNVTLTIDNKYRQSLELVLYQKFGEDTLRHTMGNVYNEIINLEDASYVDYMDSAKKYTGYDFSVDGENSHVYYSGDVVSEFSVVYTTDLGGKGSIDEDNGVWHITNDGIKGVPTFMFVPKKAYRLAFNENVGSSEAKAFVGTQGGLIHDWHVDELSVDSDGNWEPYITYFDTDDNKTFPKIYYRVGYCSDGYTFDPDDATNGVYTELDNDFIKKYNELGKIGEIVLYAHWKSCDNKYYTVTSPDLKYGTMSLLRHSDSYYLNMNSEREYPITAGGLKIPYVKNANNEALDVFFDEFRFEGKGDYDQLYFGKLDFLYYRAKGSDSWVSVEKDSDEKIEKYGLNNASVYDYFEVNADMEVSVRFGKHFLANASNDEVFFGPNWVWDGLYGIGDVVDDKAFSAVPDVGRAGACVVGWGEPIKDADYLVLFDDIDAMIDASAFYAIWNDTKLGGTVGAHLSFNSMDPNLLQQIGCDTTTYTIISTLKQDEPMLILTQTVGDSVFSHWVGESGLKVPAYLKNMKFSADVEHFDNYAAKAIYVMDTQGNVLDTVAPGEPFEIKGNTVIKVDLGKGDGSSIHVSLNENSDDPIYFGDDWTDEISYEGGDSVVLPTIVYNAEKCLAGWAIDPTSEELLKVLDKDLFDELQAKSRATGVALPDLLYAKWTTNLDSCAGDFMKLAVEQENGSVWFAESDKDKTVERRFTEDGTMFVPMELNGRNFRVRAMGADTSVYVLDSLVVLRDGKTDTVLHEGDYMPEILDNVTLKAYFGWKNKTKLDFARARLDSTGCMFMLSFTASDFEVRRKVSAKVQVVDIVKDSIVTQSVFGDSVAMGFDTTFVFRMKKPGNYRMVVTLEDKTGVKEKFSREISVDPVISSIAADSWQMLSLSAVDMSAVTWDGDQVFYWWDEYGTGEFWQYKQLTKNDSLDATRGVWYNSLEGRPLPLRDEIDDEGEDFVWELDKANSGWNMVANPHGWAVNLFANYPDAAKDIDENPDVLFWSWNTTTGQYDPMFEEIGPYEAVWVQVSKDTKWKVSAAPAFKGESKAVEKSRSLAKSKTKDRWTLQAKLLDKNGKQDSWNILGAGLNPLSTEEPPESMADHVNLSIVDGKRALAKSIKEASDEMEWTIALSASSDRIGYLSFDGVDGVNAYGYHVFVTVDGNTTEMQNGVPLKVYLKSTAKTATVRVAPAARVVAQNTLKGLRMARLGNHLRVSFEASEGLAGTNARVDILDMKGHVMSTVTAKTLDGSNALVLDAPQTGLYMLRVRAGSEQQAKKIVVK